MKSTYVPLPIDGSAIEKTFFSSASVKQLLISASNFSSLFDALASYVGEKAWIICLNFIFGASPSIAERNKIQ